MATTGFFLRLERGRRIRSSRATFVLASFVFASCSAGAADIDEYKIKREANFEFVSKPSLMRDGDQVTIRFTTKGFCDITVAVEAAQGNILRHLASGVLGPKAPAPFKRNLKKQEVVC